MPTDTIQRMEERLRAAPEGTAGRVDALNDLAWEVWSRDVERAARLTALASAEAKALEYEKGYAYAQCSLGLFAYGRGDVEGGLNELNAAHAWFADHGETEGEARTSTGLAYIHWSLGDFRRGFDLAEKALVLYRGADHIDGQGWVLSALGTFYHDWNDHAKSLESYQRAHNVFLETDNITGQARALNGIGNAHHLLREFDAALAYQDKSVELHRSEDNKLDEAKTLNDIGLILQSMGRYEEAIEHHKRSLELREQFGYVQGSSTCLLDLARACLALRCYPEVETTLERALAVSEKIQSKTKVRRAHELYAQLYRDTGRFDEALAHYEKFHRLTEEVFNEDFEQKLKNLRAAHEIEASAREAEMQRLLNVELNDKNEQLEETLRELRDTQAQLLHDGKMAALGSLVAGLVHEVNTPVGAIVSSMDTTLRAIERLTREANTAAGGKEARDHGALLDLLQVNAQNALSSAQRLHTIVGSLKNFARLDEAPFQRIDIHAGIESTLTLIAPEIGDGVRVTKEFGALPRVFAYPSELNQVFMNLLLNAAQAHRDRKGSISIRTWAGDGRVNIEIADDGRGIAPEKLEHLFEPGFTRKQDTVRMRTGLYTSYNIVRNHRGDIAVDSTVGRGTTFRVSIPDNLEKAMGSAGRQSPSPER
jgi:signal transduction histidine kinase